MTTMLALWTAMVPKSRAGMQGEDLCPVGDICQGPMTSLVCRVSCPRLGNACTSRWTLSVVLIELRLLSKHLIVVGVVVLRVL